LVLLEKFRDISVGRKISNWMDIALFDLYLRVGGSEMNWSGSGWRQFVNLCEPWNEYFSSTNWGKFFD